MQEKGPSVPNSSKSSGFLTYQVRFAIDLHQRPSVNILSVAGDLLRAEQTREGSEFGELIRTCIKEGTIVPMEITVKLLENAMEAEIEKKKGIETWSNGKGRFLIDGFPRKMDQALKFEEVVRLFITISFTT